MRKKYYTKKMFAAFLFALFLSGGAVVSRAAETEQNPPSSVVVVEPGYPAEKPADADAPTDTRSATVGDGSLPPVPVRVVRRTSSGDVVTQQSAPVAVPVPDGTPPDVEGQNATTPDGTDPETSSVVADETPIFAGPTTIRRPAAATGAEVGRWEPRHKAIVVSDGAALMDPGRREEELARIAAGKFTRVLSAFGPAAMETLRAGEGSQQLYDLLRSASEKGLVVDLLLKAPGQLSAGAWSDMNSLLGFFRAFPFRSVHLDLSAETVTDAASAGQLIAALESAVAAAGRPVGITIDPRVLEGGLGDFVASAFYRLNLTDVALSIYSTNAEEVAARFQSVCRFYVDLPFSLVQCIGSDRPRTESYFTSGVTIFGRRMQKLCFDTAASNAQDLIVDSYEDYVRMQP